jgi:hypothetical protein
VATLYDTKMAKTQLLGCGNTEGVRVARVANISQRNSGNIHENIRLANCHIPLPKLCVVTVNIWLVNNLVAGCCDTEGYSYSCLPLHCGI